VPWALWTEEDLSSLCSALPSRCATGAVAAIVAAACLQRRRNLGRGSGRCGPLRAVGRVVRPPLPPWYTGNLGNRGKVIDVTPEEENAEAASAAPSFYVHPVVLKVESAISSDSLRTLCTVLSGASGFIAPAANSPNRSRKPIMDAAITIRALLRFVELRHGVSDDLKASDFAGKCGSGLRVLLQKCREYEMEVIQALDTRVDDVVGLIRAFYDQARLISKFTPFFRTLIERAIPAILQRKIHPLPQVLNFLESYNDLHLTFLAEAARRGTLKKRIAELDPAQLLDVVRNWSQRARSGRLAIINEHRTRELVRLVSLMDLELLVTERTEWCAACLWASVPATTPEFEWLEKRIRDGIVEREDPVELFALAIDLCIEGNVHEDFFKLHAKHLWHAFQAAGDDRTRLALSEVTSFQAIMQQSSTYPQALLDVLTRACAEYAAKAAIEQLERLLVIWVRRSLNLRSCALAVAEALVRRVDAEEPLGLMARCGRLFCDLGVDKEVLAPLTKWLMGCRANGYSSEVPAEEAYINPRAFHDLRDTFCSLEHLWPQEGALTANIQEAEAALRLVGPAQNPPREVDIAARTLVGTLGAQLVELEADVIRAVEAWQQQANQSLTTLLAPFILRTAHEKFIASGDLAAVGPSGAIAAGAPAGDLRRSAELLAAGLKGKPLGLRTAAWALEPFCRAGEAELAAAVSVVAQACGVNGAPQEVIAEAARNWVTKLCPSTALGMQIIYAALAQWERNPLEDGSMALLEDTCAWLEGELESLKDPEVGIMEGNDTMVKALQGLKVLVDVVHGTAPSLLVLRKLKRLVKPCLGPVGLARLAEAVARAWADAVPGMSMAVANAYFAEWWRRGQDRVVAQQIASVVVEELKYRTKLRYQATFPGASPTSGQTPAWRLEGRAKVPWFLPKSTVAAAFEQPRLEPTVEKTVDPYLALAIHVPCSAEPASRRAERALLSPVAVERAVQATGGRCMYCGSNFNLKARMVWPEKLGGGALESNLAAACPLCIEFMESIGPKAWGEALAAKPEVAADAWWLSQKEASMNAIEFLAQGK